MKSTPKAHFQGLRTAIYCVTDMEQAKAWYSKILGFAPYFDQPFYIGFEVAGFELGLMPDETTSPKTDNIHMYWGVEDINESYHRLLEFGARSIEKPNEVGENLWVATVKDPWDNLFGIIQNPYFKLPNSI
jgi:predicted enzyme related to lactoylglutathione lyase